MLGLAAIGLATASATVWRPDDGVVADAADTGVSTLLVTAPGVLELVDPQVTIEASRPDGGEVVLAVGREVDVTGWVGDDAHAVVTGLASWESLATSFVEGETEPVEPDEDEDAEDEDAEGTPAEDADSTPAEATDDAAAGDTTSGPSGIVGPDPYASDMWLARAEGEGSAQLEWTAPETGRYVLLAASVGDDAPPPAVTLSWPREVSTPLLIPGVALGSVLVLIAAILGVLELRRSRRAAVAPTETGAVPVQPVEGQPVLTRSALRAARSAGTSPSATAASAPTSSTPVVAPAQGWRRVDLAADATGDSGTPAASGAQASSAAPATSTPPAASTAPTTGAATFAATSSPTAPVAEPAPMSRRELRERAEREAALRAQERARSRRWHRKGDQGGGVPTAASGTPAAVSTQSAATPVVTGIASQTQPASSAAAAGATDSAEPARADAWRKAWGFDTSWSPQGPAAPRGDGQDDATSTDAGDQR